MQTPQDFIESYLREKKEMDQGSYERSLVLHQKFFTDEYVKRLPDWHAQMGPDRVVSVEASDGRASVITARTFMEQQLRFRFLLKLAGSDWQIDGTEWECNVCHGTGRMGTKACPICEGAGWKACGPRAV